MSRFTLHALAVGVATASLSLSAQAATEVSWWHAMGGQLGEILEGITEDFNASRMITRSRPATAAPIPKP